MAGRWIVSPTRSLTLDRARVIAILNVTPDSFSDGGLLRSPEDAARAAAAALEAGADMLDVGGESSRPGSEPVDAAEQIRRVAPAISAIRRAGVEAPISIDTRLADVAEAGLDAGADAINDISAGRDDPRMFGVASARRAGLVLMHRLTPSRDDEWSDRRTAPPDYGDEGAGGGVVSVVGAFLQDCARAAMQAGVAREAIVIDPGLGFGKSVEQNFTLIARTTDLASLGFPVMAGASRKSFIGAASGVQAPAQRIAGSVAASVAQRLGGALLFRVHDVAEHAQALRVADRIAQRAG